MARTKQTARKSSGGRSKSTAEWLAEIQKARAALAQKKCQGHHPVIAESESDDTDAEPKTTHVPRGELHVIMYCKTQANNNKEMPLL